MENNFVIYFHCIFSTSCPLVLKIARYMSGPGLRVGEYIKSVARMGLLK